MSRPSFSGGSSSRPNFSPASTAARPSIGTRPSTGSRPSQGQLSHFLDLKPSTGGSIGRPSQLPATGGGAARDFLQNRPDGRPTQLPAGGNRPGIGSRPGIGERPVVGERPGIGSRPGIGQRPAVGERPRPGERPGRPDLIANKKQWVDNRKARRNEVNVQLNNRHYNYRNWYTNNFWRRYPNLRWHYGPGFNCWRWATWGAVAAWLPWGWAQPVYYYYGDNVYYQDGNVYYGDQVYATADEYAQQAAALATSAPDVDADSLEWMPLGVFAVTQDGQADGPPPSLFFQLTVSKQGIIAGTYQNTSTDTVVSIEGMVDKKTQRAAWTVVGHSRPIIETGIQNLTQDTAPALIHFEDGRTQQVLLVRLDNPNTENTQP